MRKDITKKFLGKEGVHIVGKMLSKDVCIFIFRKKINIDAQQISYDDIEFRIVFSATKCTKLDTNNILDIKIKEFVSKNGKTIEFNMIYCAEGVFEMGSESALEKNPKKQAWIEKPFLLGETEVTQELYELVMGYNPSKFQWEKDSKQRPVEGISWYDAIDFCNKLSVLTNKSPYYEIKGIEYEYGRYNIKEANVTINEGANGFRLPLEKEWEYAAKAGTNNRWSGTSDKSRLEEYAWVSKTISGETHPVAKKKPNEWGFYDMSGIVAEWCYDRDKWGSVVSRGGGGQILMTNTQHRVFSSASFSPTIAIGIRVSLSTKFTMKSLPLLKNGDKIKKFVEKEGKRIEFDMIYCAKDTFIIDLDDPKDEKSTKHQVEIEKPFLLGETEVTQELYELVMGYNPSRFKRKKDLNPSQRPVEKVTWYDAIMFCNKLSALLGKNPYYEIKDVEYYDKQTMKDHIIKASVKIKEYANGFRLPLEKEWEYAARAGTNNEYAGTNDIDKLEEYAWFLKNSNNETHPVAMKKPNEWGFCDMSGNVSEWCYDDYYQDSRVNRGGSWSTWNLQSAYRGSDSLDTRDDNLGFRVAAYL